jgi:hypothetical protein
MSRFSIHKVDSKRELGYQASMRAIIAPLLCLCLLVTLACGRSRRGGRDGYLGETAPVDPPKDKIFVDFAKNWRQVISESPELALPVTRPERPAARPWQPRVLTQCVFSDDAGGLVPQVTLSWNETDDIILLRAKARQTETPPLRFDLAVHFDGFSRNYLSAALSTGKLERFKLPSNSPLVKDQAAVLESGPGLFPKVVEYRTESLQERDTQRAFVQHTLALRDLNHAVSYTIRMDRREANGWTEDSRFEFQTPVCPTSF